MEVTPKLKSPALFPLVPQSLATVACPTSSLERSRVADMVSHVTKSKSFITKTPLPEVAPVTVMVKAEIQEVEMGIYPVFPGFGMIASSIVKNPVAVAEFP